MNAEKQYERLHRVKVIPAKPTVGWLRKQLKRLDKGRLYCGGHDASEGEFCALEFVNVVKDGATGLRVVPAEQKGWGDTLLGNLSDCPTNVPDLRELNDNCAWATDKARTDQLLPVLAALWNWKKWTAPQKRAFTAQLIRRCKAFEGWGDDYKNYDLRGVLSNLSDWADAPARLVTACQLLRTTASACRGRY